MFFMLDLPAASPSSATGSSARAWRRSTPALPPGKGGQGGRQGRDPQPTAKGRGSSRRKESVTGLGPSHSLQNFCSLTWSPKAARMADSGTSVSSITSWSTAATMTGMLLQQQGFPGQGTIRTNVRYKNATYIICCPLPKPVTSPPRDSRF